jgi:UDP-glucose 4-epimerase
MPQDSPISITAPPPAGCKLVPVHEAFLRERLHEFVALDRQVFGDGAWGEENFLREVPGKFVHSVAALSGTGVAGYLIASRAADSSIHVHRLATAPAVRRGGLGRALLAHLDATCRDNGASRITLEFASSLGVLPFYEAAGYSRLNENQIGAYLYAKPKTAQYALYAGATPERCVMHKVADNGEVVLVTGGAGFVGMNLCEHLSSSGCTVRSFDNLSSTPEGNFDLISKIPRVDAVRGDIRDLTALRSAAEGATACIHLAFPTSRCDRQFANQFPDVAAAGTLNVLECCREFGMHCIYISCISVYGVPDATPLTEESPVNPFVIYGAHKLLGELYVRSYRELYGLRSLIVRLGDLFGKFDNRHHAIRNFFAAAQRKEPLHLGNDGSSTRSYLHANDAVNVLRQFLRDRTSGTTVNLVNQDHITIKELAGQILAICGSDQPALTGDAVDSRRYEFDSRHLRNLTSVRITPVRQALRMAYEKGDFS